MAKPTRTDEDKRGLTPFGRSVALAGAVLLFFGLIFGDYPYLLGAMVLLGVAYWSRGLGAPQLRVTRALSAQDVRAGEPLDVELEVANQGEDAAISVHDRVPDVFLMDEGSNFEAAWAPSGGATRFGYRLRAPRRGAHAIGPLRATVYDPLFLHTANVEALGETSEVVVHPKTPPVPRIRTGAAWGRTNLPGGDKATRGILTNDFRELRPYERGDPLKKVNWKATARQSREHLELIVNDYEVEGKKVVWIFADASPYTVGGTNVANAYDEIAAGALAVAAHYLDLGHRVGFTLFGGGQTRLLYADAGELQERRIAAALGGADPAQPGEGIAKAVEATKGFLAREKPLLFVFTLAGRDPDLARALVSARALASTGRRPAPIVCATPIVEEALESPTKRALAARLLRREARPVDSTLAARVVALHERAQLKGLERRGVRVLRYHPQKAPLQATLARGILR